MNKSESIKNIALALSVFHKECGKIKKNATNPFFKNTYADLPTVLDSIKEPLSKAGLVFTQFPTGENGLSTILIHSDTGEWIESTYIMTPSKNDPQGQGSVITYQRRYALGAILGLSTEKDDDGNIASSPSERTVKYEEDDNKVWFNAKIENHIEILNAAVKKGHSGSDLVKAMRTVLKVNKADAAMMQKDVPFFSEKDFFTQGR